jgi:hypothetical protein
MAPLHQELLPVEADRNGEGRDSERIEEVCWWWVVGKYWAAAPKGKPNAKSFMCTTTGQIPLNGDCPGEDHITVRREAGAGFETVPSLYLG